MPSSPIVPKRREYAEVEKPSRKIMVPVPKAKKKAEKKAPGMSIFESPAKMAKKMGSYARNYKGY